MLDRLSAEMDCAEARGIQIFTLLSALAEIVQRSDDPTARAIACKAIARVPSPAPVP